MLKTYISREILIVNLCQIEAELEKILILTFFVSHG